MTTRAKWGQNFLSDDNIARKCVAALQLTPQDTVLEIGPGKGALTKHLLAQAQQVIAVELDRELYTFLQQEYPDQKNLILHNQDFLDTDLRALNLGHSYKIISNLPYAVCAPILQKLLGFSRWQRMVVMVQREVAERMVCPHGSKNYGILSISVQVQSQVKKLFHVPKGCFRPVPKVESTVLELLPHRKPLLKSVNEKIFFTVVRAAFAHRRKTLINSLERHLEISSAEIDRILRACKVNPKLRAEKVSVEQFCAIAKMMPAGKKKKKLVR